MIYAEGLKDMTPQQLADIIRMGSWRIGKLAIPQIELLVSQIEMQWREYLPDVRPSSVLEVMVLLCCVVTFQLPPC